MRLPSGRFSRRFLRDARAGLCLATLAGSACGGSASSPTGSGSPPPVAGEGPRVTISSAGVSPKETSIAVGERVTFVNEDSAAHEMASNPHPTHGDCPPINEVDALAPGQSRPTGVFMTPGTCGFHDHGQPSNASLQGTIVVR